MKFAALEEYLTDCIEGFFNKRFSGIVEPVELVFEIAREVYKQRRPDGKQYLAPNEYNIFLTADDYSRLISERVITLLDGTVRKEVIKRNLFLDGELSISLKKDPDLSGGFSLVSRFSPEGKNADAPKKIDDEDHTLVLTKQKFKPPLNLPAEQQFATISVIVGADTKAYAEIGAKKIFIGRQECSDFILTDDSVSRIHASIEYKNGRHFLRDEKSANGTFINGERIVAPTCLCVGDEMKFGETIVRYEVM